MSRDAARVGPNGSHQPRLVNTIRNTAKWRRSKSYEFAADADEQRKNRRSMVALQTLANFVEALPDADPDLACLRHSAPAGEQYRLCPEALRLLSRFGLNYGMWHADSPTEAQMRNILRRIEGAEARLRASLKPQSSTPEAS